MTASVFASATAGHAEIAPRPRAAGPSFAGRVVAAIFESRMRAADRELRRREAFLNAIAGRQDHSPRFLNQSEQLPLKL